MPFSAHFVGCVYNNFLLALGESFLIACDRVCRCERPDLIQCQEKTCPQWQKQEQEGVGCRLVADPADPCCQVRECPSQVEPRALRRILVEEEEDLELLVDLSIEGSHERERRKKKKEKIHLWTPSRRAHWRLLHKNSPHQKLRTFFSKSWTIFNLTCRHIVLTRKLTQISRSNQHLSMVQHCAYYW